MTRIPSPFDPPRVKVLTPAQLVPVLRANAKAYRDRAASSDHRTALLRLAAEDDARADEIERTGRDPLAAP